MGEALGGARREIVCGRIDSWAFVRYKASFIIVPRVNAVPVNIASVNAV